MTSIAPIAPPSRLSPRAVGLLAAVVTVAIWTSFIVIARASADPARGGSLGPFDIVYARLWGAGLVLLPWGWWLSRRARLAGQGAGSLGGAYCTHIEACVAGLWRGAGVKWGSDIKSHDHKKKSGSAAWSNFAGGQ